jgi:hypothetical protein
MLRRPIGFEESSFETNFGPLNLDHLFLYAAAIFSSATAESLRLAG